MPGFDGTGSQGRGPMTGRAGGYCMLKIPDAPDVPWTGFAGLAGETVNTGNHSHLMAIVSLQNRLRGVQTAFQELKRRLANLAADGCTGVPRTSSTGDNASSGQADGGHS